jgi:DNA polymerase-3 subunit delta
MAKSQGIPPGVVIYGDEEHLKDTALTQSLDALLPPSVERALALSTYEGGRSAEQGGATIATVLEDLATLPFLAERRVVLVRDADAFITAHRERLEKYLSTPSRTGVLILICRSFAKTTRLHKTAVAAGGQVRECSRLFGRALLDYAVGAARGQGKQLEPDAAARLVDLVGQDTGMLSGEVEKLCLYVGDRPAITERDVSDLVGQTREEKIFAVADAAAAGRLPDALRLWDQVLETDPEAAYRAVGGLAFVARRWLAAQRLSADGESAYDIAPKVMMWGRQRELQTILQRMPARRGRRVLAAIADLDSQAKSGARSIERGVELLLVRLAAPAN